MVPRTTKNSSIRAVSLSQQTSLTLKLLAVVEYNVGKCGGIRLFRSDGILCHLMQPQLEKELNGTESLTNFQADQVRKNQDYTNPLMPYNTPATKGNNHSSNNNLNNLETSSNENTSNCTGISSL
ncbi:hypothetical protein M0804_009036 [Polistes exclamans]|nr:hypothetical protein M0804_009036 [Polistes exclamans]